MSRIGNKVITLPAGVEITNNDNVVTVKGPKGELTREFNKNIEIKVEGNEVTLHRPKVSTKKLLVKQQLTSVAFVLQNLTKVKVSVTLVNTYVVKKVKLVNNRILSLWLFFLDFPLTKSSHEQSL